MSVSNCPMILICDDDPVVHESMGLYLDSEGYSHVSAYDGEQAIEMANAEHPDLMILDLMMPKLTGTDVCREIRKSSKLPIIMLTAKSEEIDRILGLELGADDYIVKPFSPREVLARIRAVLRRFAEPQEQDDEAIIRFPQLEINLSNYQVKAMGQVVPCTPKEVEILHMLTSSAGQVFSREQILSRVWGYDYFGDTRTVDTHIKRIRQKLPQEGVPWKLKTIYGVGYKFEVEE
ncbi:response regulator transcription factor [Eubacteriales bacterium OttesenSCG-928-N13]|nr:response regulator transcription factor [Eubacteriales bacterium OttesenSCG-928-N13]